MTVSDVHDAALGPLAALALPTVVADPLGHVVWANAAAEELLGTGSRSLRGRLLVSFFAAGSRRPVVRTLLRREGSVPLLTLQGRDGPPRPVRLVAAPHGDDVACVILDRSAEVRETDRARILSDRLDRADAAAGDEATGGEVGVRRVRLGRLLEEIDQGVVALDADLGVRFANDAALALLDGLERGQRLPPKWHDFDLHGFALSLFEAGAVSADATVEAGERLVRLGGVPAADDLAVVLVTDVTERARHDQAERDFVANAAHELLNPVAAIMSAADALELASGDRRERERFLAHIVRECRRLDRLLRALLDLARVQDRGRPPTLEPVHLRALLDRIADRLQPRPEVRVSVLCPPTLTLATNPELLEHAVTNLAANAVRHTVAGEVRITALTTRSNVVIDVDDSGPGIPADERLRVLERFYRLDPGGGAGLGLAIARQAVEAIQGRIELRDSPLGGTRVRIVLAQMEAA